MSEMKTTAADLHLAALRSYFAEKNVPLDKLGRLRGAYLNTDKDDEMRAALDAALVNLPLPAQDGERIEGRGMVVVAESGCGKSRRIRRMLASHPLFRDIGKPNVDCPAIMVRCTQSCTLAVLGELILAASGYPLEKELRANVAWRHVRKRLEERGIMLIYIDEINNLIENSNKAENKKNRNALKALLNSPTWPVALILAGTSTITSVLQVDAQLRRRLNWMGLEVLSAEYNDMFAAFVEALCKPAGIEPPNDLLENCVPRLIYAALNRLGIAAELAIAAVEKALLKSQALAIDHFAAVYGERTGCKVSENPFLAVDWTHVDCTIVLSTLKEDETA